MSLGETRAILQDLFQQFQQAEELSLLKSISETKQKTNQYCQHSLSKARNQVSELSAELESEERKLTDAKSQLKHEQYLSEMHQLSQQRADNETRIKQSQKNIQQLSEEHDNLQVELNRLQSDAESQELDVIGLRLKIYRSIGFDWQGQHGPNSLPLTKCRVRSAMKNDVQTILLESQPERRFFMANNLWDIVSGAEGS